MTRQADVIVGFNCGSIFRHKLVRNMGTKYDPITGVPSLQFISWGDSEYTFGDIKLTKSTYKSYFNELGLTYVKVSTMGIKIATCYNYDEEDIEIDVITNAKIQVEKILEQLGWDFKVKLIVSCEFDNYD